MEEYNFYYQLRVRYSEIDGQRVVFNSRFMEYLDITMDEYCRRLFGKTWANAMGKPLEMALVRVEIDFIKPAYLDDLLRVYCKIIRMGTSSMEVKFTIVREGHEAVLLKARIVYVVFDVEKAQTSPIPADIRARISEFEGLNA